MRTLTHRITVQLSLELGTPDGFGLVLEMIHRRDRFAAEILFRGPESSTEAVLRSEEGDDAQLWPPSPTIQQVVPQNSKFGELLFGVGMAGKSHWSVSVEVLQGEAKALQFDVACRLRTQPEWLGSTYRILRGQSVLTERGAGVVLGEHLLLVEPAEDTGRCAVTLEDRRLLVAARLLPNDPLPRTVCWKYRMSLVAQP